MKRRTFLTASGAAFGAAALPGVGSAARDEATVETDTLYTVFPWGGSGYASVEPDESGEFGLVVNGTRVRDVSNPLWFTWQNGGEYATVSDGGNLKAIKADRGVDVKTATTSGNDILPVFDGADVFFKRVDSIFKIENVPSLFRRGSGGRTTNANRFNLPSGNVGGGRNTGRKNVYGREIAGKRIQVKTPKRNRYPRNIVGHRENILAGNVEVYDVNKYASNDLIANWHIGYRRDKGRRPHCVSVFDTVSERGGEKCFRSIRRMLRNAWRWASRQMGRVGSIARRHWRPVARVALYLAAVIGSSVLSLFGFGS